MSYIFVATTFCVDLREHFYYCPPSFDGILDNVIVKKAWKLSGV
jgi:hypothetical protein